jgi:hypothetical protein
MDDISQALREFITNDPTFTCGGTISIEDVAATESTDNQPVSSRRKGRKGKQARRQKKQKQRVEMAKDATVIFSERSHPNFGPSGSIIGVAPILGKILL